MDKALIASLALFLAALGHDVYSVARKMPAYYNAGRVRRFVVPLLCGPLTWMCCGVDWLMSTFPSFREHSCNAVEKLARFAAGQRR